MPNQVFEENFTGKYDGVTPALLLPPGSLSDGGNMRKVSPKGGWKVRKGCLLNNTTAAESGATINSLHKYENPRSADYHFLAQCNSKLLDATNDPPAAGTTFGTTLGVTVGTTPGFSCLVKEDFFYADGSGRPIAYGGGTPYCIGFLVWDNSESAYMDYTRVVTDGRTDTLATMASAANDKYYVCMSEKGSGITLVFTATNNNAVTPTIKAWRSGAFATVGTISDGTKTTQTHDTNGSLTWTASASDTMSVLGGIMGYWYEVSFSGAIDAFTVSSCKVVRAASLMTNKWNGTYEYVAGCRFFDVSVGSGEYDECLGLVSNESTSQYIDMSSGATGDYLYIKTVEPATGFGLGVVIDYTNTNDAQVDLVEYWNGSAFSSCYPTASVVDSTLDVDANSSFSQSGVISWNAAELSPKKRILGGDQVPGYWYRISWDAALSSDVYIYLVVYIPFPETLPAYDGCVEFKGRLLLWGDPEYPNRLRYSALDKPDCLSGADSGYTDPFGDMKKVLCAINFYNELIVFKEDSVWLLEGHSPQTFGTLKVADTIGLASPQTARVVEVGSPGMHEDEPLSIAIWQDVDGIYVLDGRKPRKVSMPIDHYFNTEYTSTVIAAASIRNRSAFIDPLNNEYHFLLPAGELVYNYATDEWYPPWDREIDLTCGLSLRGTDDRYYTYGGAAGGWVMRLENDTADKTTANADKIITHSVKTRSIGVPVGEGAMAPAEFTLRKLWAKLKARSAGSIVTKTFQDMATSGTAQSTPQAMSMINTGYSIAVPGIDLSEYRCKTFQVEFSLATADQEMEIWSMPYEAEVRSALGVP